MRGYETGAVDYVPVPVVPEILRAKVRIFAELWRKTRQLERLNDELEQRVRERTAELEASTVQLRECSRTPSPCQRGGGLWHLRLPSCCRPGLLVSLSAPAWRASPATSR